MTATHTPTLTYTDCWQGPGVRAYDVYADGRHVGFAAYRTDLPTRYWYGYDIGSDVFNTLNAPRCGPFKTRKACAGALSS